MRFFPEHPLSNQYLLTYVTHACATKINRIISLDQGRLLVMENKTVISVDRDKMLRVFVLSDLLKAGFIDLGSRTF